MYEHLQQSASVLHSLSPEHLLSTFGVAGVMVVLFIQTGLLIGFFLPGDSLLFLAGYATDENNNLGIHLPLGWLLIAAAVGAVAGGQVGFEIGRAGEGLQDRPDSRWFKKDYVERADAFLRRFGETRAVVLSRFVPIVRTFVGPILGVAGEARRPYAVASAVGGVVWTTSIILLGHFTGHVTFIRKYVEILAVAAVVISVAPVIWHMMRHKAPPAEDGEDVRAG
ncbi:MAG TPA: VTT domain-containing protein [Mycobacteriales bacterium]|nr:VTT domain-containing protein [Mycobacteriales bacterium]